MCEFQTKLIAFLDRELPSEEVAGAERHIERCEECRNRLAGYELVNETFDAYCDAVMAAKTRRSIPHWVPVLASALVAGCVMLLAFLQTRVEPLAIVAPTVASAAVPIPVAPHAAEPAARKATVRRRHVAPLVQECVTEMQPMDTAIEIAIPAEAMFAPGAMPNGINFIAELRIAPDGSVKQVRLRQ